MDYSETSMTKAFKVLMIGIGLAAAWTTAPGQTPTPSPARTPLPPVRIGPPAPVPPAVEMLRPSTSELTEINAELKRLIASDKSYPSIVVLDHLPPKSDLKSLKATGLTIVGARNGRQRRRFL